jgi:agmatine deiminase
VIEIEGRDRYRAPFVLGRRRDSTSTARARCSPPKECLLNPNRNRTLDAGQLEILLHDTWAISSVIWLIKGRRSTTRPARHVDNLCCFARPGEESC